MQQPQHEMKIRDLFIRPDSLSRPYYERSASERKSIHFGQLKLLISEIAFFTLFWNPAIIPNPLIVYAGAAPGNHIPFLLKLFPMFTFHLYDPSPYNIRESKEIKIFRQLFTNTIAQQYQKENDRILFISDIRRFGPRSLTLQLLKQRGYSENDFDRNIPEIKAIKHEVFLQMNGEIWEDMKMQEEWVKIINPVFASLKMKFPFPEEKNKSQNFTYLQGQLLIQPWAPQDSAETRLIAQRINNQYVSKIWNNCEYEELCFFHNTIEREEIQYRNPLTSGIEPIDAPELLNDYDSTAHTLILKAYVQKMMDIPPQDIPKTVVNLSEEIMLFFNERDLKNQISLSTLRTSEFKQIRFYVNNVLKKNKQKSKPPQKKAKKVNLDVSKVKHPRLK